VKLALHLLLAFSLFAALLWTYWRVAGHARHTATRRTAWFSRITLGLLTIQIGFGALVAGLRAGKTYNTFPLMDGQLIPSGLQLMQPWWRNHLENVMTVQFQHRALAVVVLFALLSLVAGLWRHAPLQRLMIAILAVVLMQFALGVATLLSHVDLLLASLHQCVALLLFALLLRLAYQTAGEPATASHSQL
jgi:cytochrome c oxidase assembly protein subunit 15